MTEGALRPANVAAAALVLGGGLVIVLPQYAESVLRIVLLTTAAGVGLYALVVNVPPAWWTSPLDRMIRAGREAGGSDELESIRSKLAKPRRSIRHGPAVPSEVVRLLKPLVEAALEREGLDPGVQTHRDRAGELVSSLTWAVLTTEPPERRRLLLWRWPDRQRVADVVHHVLDDLERLPSAGRTSAGSPDPRASRVS